MRLKIEWFKRVYFSLFYAILSLFDNKELKRMNWLKYLSACVFFTIVATVAQGTVSLKPDYANITVPPNIAPLNFDVLGAPKTARVILENGDLSLEFSQNVRIKPKVWRRLLAKGGAYTITVKDGENTLFQATNTIASDVIAPTLAYRLIPPSYENYQNVGIYW